MTKRQVWLIAGVLIVVGIGGLWWSLRETRQTLDKIQVSIVGIGVQYVCLRVGPGGGIFTSRGEAATFEDARCGVGSQPFKHTVDGGKGEAIYNEYHKDPSGR